MIAAEDPRAADVVALLDSHLELMNALSPPAEVHALDVEALVHPAITFVGYRVEGELLAVGALKDLGDGHGELKSMHTAAAARGLGIGGALVLHLVDLARRRGLTRVSLETGTPEGFAAARGLYARHGFTECGPFGDYVLSPWSTFMTLPLD
ncbi:GNAT family N-acetyltransferase [Nocardioides aquiterrae]|uniref:GNAT family N-acetyltransferase n=1 Tax=Nocardioides aquiterrae TaxID=203799 RepID=A0ABN1U712_9ACTN